MVSIATTNKQILHRIGDYNTAPSGFDVARHLPPGFIDFFMPLHQRLTPKQQSLIALRAEVLRTAHAGGLPNYLRSSDIHCSDWQIELPSWCSDQRNQMTGPADDAELVVKMLNSGAPGVMLDVEDSMANCWSNLETGIRNILLALKGELTYEDSKRRVAVGVKPSETVIFTRPRGLHLSQAGVLPGELISASLFDVALIAYQIDATQLKHPLCFYIPKSESANEAIWWRELFQAVEDSREWPRGFIKCMALVESHPLAYQIEEFIYNLREHLVGLNLGRWDYMASLIHFNLEDPNWVLPDRNSIPHNVPFFQNLRELLVDTCHKRGVLAIGGMTALFPSRNDPQLNEKALRVLAEDKQNEASCLMDGAWTGHPDQNGIAVQQFPFPNQRMRRKPGTNTQPDLRPQPKGIGSITLAGTRDAIRTAIRYRNGVLNGKGASLLDGYMEDLATDRIYRLMIAQRMRHRDIAKVIDSNGRNVRHTPALITELFDEELERIVRELPEETKALQTKTLCEARRITEALILNEEFDPI